MTTPTDPIYKYQPLFGSWKIEEEIGEGSFGIVYRVSKEQLGQKYISAVKLISIPSKEQYREAKSSLGTDVSTLHAYFQDIVENIIKEVNILHSLSGNNNILNYHDHTVIEREDKIGWDILIRMEYVTSLPKYLETNSLNREQVIRLGIDICSALEMCSKKGIIHRDIKDENIFVNEDEVFKLGDFGIARELSGSGRAASMRGTPLYMAPEVYRGEKYDAAVDIYSLGIVLYKLLNNGRMPFMPSYPNVIKYKDSEEALDRRMSGEVLLLPVNAGKDLGRVVLKACAYNPSDRYSSAMEMKNALVQALAELGPQERDEKVRMPFMRPEPEQQSELPAEQPKGTVSKYDGLQSFETTPDKIQEEPQPINKTMSKFSGLENVTEEKQSEYTSNFSGKENTANNLQSQEEQMKTAQLNQIVHETGRPGSTVPKQTVEPSSAVGFDKKNDFESEQKKKGLKKNRKKNVLLVFVSILIIGVSIWLFLNILKGRASESDVQTNATATTATTTPAPTSTSAPTPTAATAAETTTTNTCGNSSGNISNSGIVAQQGDWIYYSNGNASGSLYKTRTDGTERTQLNSEGSFYINVVGDWIYYSNSSDVGHIYKIRTDGTERTQMNSDQSECINVVGDWIYYSNTSDGSYVYKIRTDGTERTKLNSEGSSFLNVVGDWIYYCNYGNMGYICKIRTDGTERTKLNSDQSFYINVVGDWIYYCNNGDGSYIYKIRTDGTERTKLNSDVSLYINVVGDWIYYSNYNAYSDGGYIYKIRTDGTSLQKVV